MDLLVSNIHRHRGDWAWRYFGSLTKFFPDSWKGWTLVLVGALAIAGWLLRTLVCPENIIDLVKFQPSTYILVADRLNSKFITDAQTGKYYYSELALYKISGSDIRRSIVAMQYIPDPPQGAITIQGNYVLAFFSYKSDADAGTYNMNRVVYKINRFTGIATEASNLFTQKNWGWFPMFDKDASLIHFSYEATKLYVMPRWWVTSHRPTPKAGKSNG